MGREYPKLNVVVQAAGRRDRELLPILEMDSATGQSDAPKRVISEA
jgi:hypothetical protein